MKYRPRSGCDQLQKLDNFFILTHSYKLSLIPRYSVIHLSLAAHRMDGYGKDNRLDCRVFKTHF